MKKFFNFFQKGIDIHYGVWYNKASKEREVLEMFVLYYKPFCGETKTVSIIDEEYAYFMFNQLIKAIDCEEVDLLDGFTGEVVMEWREGKFSVINRTILH